MATTTTTTTADVKGAEGVDLVGYAGGPVFRGPLANLLVIVGAYGLEAIHYEGSLMGGPDDEGTPEDFRRAWITGHAMIELDGGSWMLYLPSEVIQAAD